MTQLLIIIIILMIISYLIDHFVITKKKENEDSITEVQEYPYKKKMLLTMTEYKFYQLLKQKCDEKNILICPKVRIEDFVDVTTKEKQLKYRGYIRCRHIDFILCDSKLHIKAGLELDDNIKNKKVDEFKNNLFKKIEIPLYRIKTNASNYEEQIDFLITQIVENNA